MNVATRVIDATAERLGNAYGEHDTKHIARELLISAMDVDALGSDALVPLGWALDRFQEWFDGAGDQWTIAAYLGRKARDPVVASAPVFVRLRHAHHQWYAEAVELRIVGVGATRDGAVASLVKLLDAYARSVARNGNAVRRKAPVAERLKVRALELVGRAMPRDWRLAVRIIAPVPSSDPRSP